MPVSILSISLIGAAASILPGPVELLIAERAARGDMLSAYAIISGIIAADMIMLAGVGAGVLALSTSNLIWVLVLMGGIGSTYLIREGVRMVVSSPVEGSTPSRRTGFAGGFATTFADPRAIAFYSVVLPGLISSADSASKTLMLLAIAISLVVLVCKSFYVLAGERASTIVLASGIQLRIRWIVAFLFGAMVLVYVASLPRLWSAI